MIRNLKALGLSLVALFAMSALSASAASANNDVFTVTGGGSAILTGTSADNVFAIGNTKFECQTSTFAGTATNNATTATVDPAYSGTKGVVPHTAHCSSSLGSVTVDTNGCHYTLTGSTTKEDPPVVGKDAVISIVCPAGQVIKITNTGTGTTVSVPSQTPTTGGVTYTNLPNHAGGAAVRINATSTGITYTCAPAFTCGLGGVPTHGNNATYVGTVTATGYADTEGLPTPVTEGARVPVSVSTKP